MISISLTQLTRRLRRRMLALVAATVTGLALIGPGIAHADSGSPAPTPPAASAAAVSPDSASWSDVTDPTSAGLGTVGDPLGGGTRSDSASWG